jgi:hypothetical protein
MKIRGRIFSLPEPPVMTRNAVMTVALFMFGYQASKLSFEHRVQIELLIRTVFIGLRLKRRLKDSKGSP